MRSRRSTLSDLSNRSFGSRGVSRGGGGITRLHVYLGCIALADVGNLLSWGLAWQFLARGLPWISGGSLGYIIPNASDAACRAFRFVHHFFHALSANWFLLMTLDRLAAMYLPLRARLLTETDAWRSVGVVGLISLAMVAPVPAFIGWNLWNNRIACLALPSYGRAVQLWTLLSNALFVLPPTVQLLAIAALNLLLLVRMRLRRRQGWVANASGDAGLPRLQQSHHRSRELGPTLQVLFLSAIFLTSGLPTSAVALIVLHKTVFVTDAEVHTLRSALNIGDIGQILLLTNQAANWLVLLWRDRRFRARFLYTVSLGRITPRSVEPLRQDTFSCSSSAMAGRHRHQQHQAVAAPSS